MTDIFAAVIHKENRLNIPTFRPEKPEHVRPHFAVYCFRYIKIEELEEDGMPSEQVISNILTEWKGIHLRKDRNPVGTVRTA